MKIISLAVIAGAALTLSACSKSPSTQCTTAPQSEWMDQTQFQNDLKDKGYTINEFVVTDGNCYEIYGMDAADKKVEIYFNPVDGSIVKSESH
ncbi:PepSY domain-containing protein [Alteromonas antoniana]|uniref:PepSY domain-containing protein n=1 Tax=Alteromonas antoniana TaxID=2803813 RepID=UPI001C47BB8B|nr:PepSY domain-containing protein [Alteromonas antoniana]